ncbi:MAG: DUF1015 domain-containing protein [Clostridia bacterium]|nr:DUF1015 domain-containing protein [Clostridia bacterium]
MKYSFFPADILLPDFSEHEAYLWAVVACDQFTSEPEYWEAVAGKVGDAPSTLHMILPEVYLSEQAERIPRINAAMEKCLAEVLHEHKDCMIYVRRQQSDSTIRQGIVGLIDLEEYDYHKGAETLIRATEGTVLERIPPRVEVRRNACLEMPHVMLLIDDPAHTVMPLAHSLCEQEPAYAFRLMIGGGEICGFRIPASRCESIQKAMQELVTEEQMQARYGKQGLAPLLFAVGDGNHSLATAKACYEELKQRLGDEALSHPARYALCEVVNLHDESLHFEPIYRIMFGVDPEAVMGEFEAYAKGLLGNADAQKVTFIWGESTREICIAHPEKQLTVGTVQDFADAYLAAHPEVEIDYIHGEKALFTLCKPEHTLGFMFDGMHKDELFRTVIFDGALPRKTFSMGHAKDKRYYLEARKISN